jgi:nucleotide-binding universal stress UspA family protein
MYKNILVTLEGTATDRAIIEHIKSLALCMHSRIVLLHVADGWAARMFGPDAISPEITEDKAYLEKICAELKSVGIPTETDLAYGEPANEIIKWVRDKGCDLIAMTSHGHKFLADAFLGSTIDKVRHNTSIPILVVRAGGGPVKPV